MKQAVTNSLFKLTAITSLVWISSMDVYAAEVSSGAIEGADLKAAVRYRHMNGNGNGMPRVLLGKIPLPSAGLTNVRWGSSNHIKYSFDAGTGNLATVIKTPSGTVSTSKNVGELGELNYILLNVQRNGHPPRPDIVNEISLENVKLNGEPLSNNKFQGIASGASWSVTGENLTESFEVEGDIVLVGQQPGSDNNHIQINVGYVDQTGPKIDQIGINPNPAILNGSTTLRATVSDADTGNSNIISAEYSLNDSGSWALMTAQDGNYDNSIEEVIAELPATQLGANKVCMRGTDDKGNITTPPTCSTFMVTYQFEGFNEPVTAGLVNSAKAAQTVPVKWRLTDANGLPIEDSVSFAGFYSYPIECGNSEHSPHDVVEEYGSGNSGLIYKGDGQWQYNWKTPKNYKDTCRAMYVEFNSGTISPIVVFDFK
ncbi:MAG: PxKF domain-containing protein [Methylicorpusculum sp.]|uniref:PxKF domain-containing protein n=1 Tax=Methylicorpusculum sp. TaxID=2713644 RepID=UPI002722D0CE|nr:PxKF domain-containing protein [Methylicorpusculum sp.]MDO8938634.1 PxKF domain-containing protein [Methylicorpusculum sp.]MDO9240116.1 PxKF domain-containing protein [Methylicorpusculum sp.]MDP2204312.1 PxKF domain-containing protein [Methylicorpusculum sp.]